MTIAITGATGQLGRLVIPKLLSKVPATDVVALVRTPSKAANLGVDVREADYGRPETLDSALKGIDTLLLISSSEFGKRLSQHTNIIESARRNGVKWIVYTSILRADSSKLNLAPEHLGTEQALKASGIPHTILRNGWYTENYIGSLHGALAGGVFLGSAGNGRVSSASRADFAEAAVAVLTGAGHAGKTYELAGDTAWTLADLTAEVTRQAGKQVAYSNIPEAEYANTLKGFGLPEFLADAIASWDTCAANGDLYDDGQELSRLIGRPTTPYSVTVGEALEAISAAV